MHETHPDGVVYLWNVTYRRAKDGATLSVSSASGSLELALSLIADDCRLNGADPSTVRYSVQEVTRRTAAAGSGPPPQLAG